MGRQNDIASSADIVAGRAEGLLNCVEVSGECLAIIWVTEDDDGVHSTLNRGRELLGGEMDQLATLTDENKNQGLLQYVALILSYL